jgi:hypothetical protein
MINMSVGEYDRVNRCRIDWKWRPVAFAQSLVTLKKAAIDQKALAVALEEMA